MIEEKIYHIRSTHAKKRDKTEGQPPGSIRLDLFKFDKLVKLWKNK